MRVSAGQLNNCVLIYYIFYFKCLLQYQLGTDLYVNLFLTMRNYLELTTSTNCGKIQHIFTKAMQHFIQKTYGR